MPRKTCNYDGPYHVLIEDKDEQAKHCGKEWILTHDAICFLEKHVPFPASIVNIYNKAVYVHEPPSPSPSPSPSL